LRISPVVLRVLIVAHGHPELNTGGAEIAAYQLFESLRRVAGVKPHFFAWVPAGATKRPVGHLSSFAGRRDETVIATSEFNSFLLSQPSAAVFQAFSLLLRRLDPQIVHFHHYTNLGIELIATARQHNPAMRLLVTLHEYLAICHHYGTMVTAAGFSLCHASGDAACAACFPAIRPSDFAQRRRYIQSHFAAVDRFIAPSAFLRRRYIDWGIGASRISVLENGVDEVRAPPARRRAPGEPRAVFGYFGQIHPFKGLLELLTAFAGLDRLSAAPAIRLIIHGAYLEANDAGYIAAFRRSLAQAGTRVQFAGPYRRRDLYRLMAQVDWVVVPSIWWENAPLVIEEALAHRRPVICSGIGGMAEKVRPGKDGFHFPVGDAMELAKLLMRLAGDNAAWDALRRTMRRPLTTEQSVARHLDLYRECDAPSG
jgi:glycosyltransferase involved in cell wall biosynthesis